MQPNQQKPMSRSTSDDIIVNNIFYTIQGEGPFCGCSALFVRLGGCNLQCPGCDTDYTSGNYTRNWSQLADTIEDLASYHRCKLVVITGGEPFRQKIDLLICKLITKSKLQVQIETNGTLPVPDLLQDLTSLTLVCSPKTSKLHPSILLYCDHYKYVLKKGNYNHSDGLPLTALNHRASPYLARPPKRKNVTVYLQPMDEQDDVKSADNLSECIKLCMLHGHRLQLQIHKIIGLD